MCDWCMTGHLCVHYFIETWNDILNTNDDFQKRNENESTKQENLLKI